MARPAEELWFDLYGPAEYPPPTFISTTPLQRVSTVLTNSRRNISSFIVSMDIW